MEPPLTLIINKISPPSLIPSYLPSTTSISPTSPVPLPPPPREFHFSPTPNYPTPYGNVSLGSTLDLDVSLENTNVGKADVLGVRMMLECQGPGGRFRLGEVIHSNDNDKSKDGEQPSSSTSENIRGAQDKQEHEALPILRYGEKVNLKIDNEIKDLGVNVLIVSVAWETLEGRKTFQRFLKFNVIPPLSIKTRIQTPSNPNTLLSPTKREQVYLEILIQNVSGESMILSNVFLEPVKGLISNLTSKEEEEKEKIILLPEDIRQFLFILSPSNAEDANTNTDTVSKSSFPPVYQPGTILPLGRLDVTWISGIYHLKGRLQTSTLNRRVPFPPTVTPAQQQQQQRGVLPARTLSSQSAIPTHGSPLSTPQKDRLGANSTNANANTLLAPSPIKGTLNTRDAEGEDQQWEVDLTMIDDQREFEVEKKFSMGFRLGVRSTNYIHEGATRRPSSISVPGPTEKKEEENDNDDDDVPLSRISSRVDQELPPPPAPRIAIQYLTPTPSALATQQSVGGPQISVLSPSRTGNPLSPAPSSNAALVDRRPFTPLSNTGAGAGPSRPMTPSSLSGQLRQAQSQGLASNQGSPRISNRFGDGTPLSFNTTTANTNQIVLDDEQVEGQDVFPPSPYITNGAGAQKTNGIINLGNSLKLLEVKPLGKVIQNIGQLAYMMDNDQDEHEIKGKHKWEVEYKFDLDFIAFDQGLEDLGGLRILILDDSGEGEKIDGKVVKEYNSLGDIYIVS
ncbi:hypothetical protein V865_000814 [Kwoniella europaea PYCC6329]|uniref:DUF974 domain-containing protein n=1 Tax=Kwoniella europaea PYCC6329 TaxID=1423913 RepID=A0AAX4K8H9_9TREE